ncbi:MFS transporter [Arthrobacter bambusae]|jgi:MFS family permease|uniref:MFS transporter n=1 Tax=Arthrobacter TaxID=1663 RepID=UPI001F50AC08|nr:MULTISPECIES: MFS transporter [Arthrobacter]MCI0143458.1 MFS transporter [Arthrobacter bambusae]UYY81047.1 MFS transporter [Arthrobacter sp. YA7-1]
MDGSNPRDVFRIPGYLAFWSAYTVSGFGTYITTLALQVLVLDSLRGTATDVGLLNAARWLPYLFFGLLAGALVDRRPRKPVLVGTDLARGILLLAIPVLYAVGRLNLVVLIVFVAFFGVFSLFGDAASQSFLPRIVGRRDLLAAHARADQSDAVAQTSGPLVAGGLVTLLGAPFAVLADAVSYLFSALAISRVRVVEPREVSGSSLRGLRAEIAEGLRWVYRHRVLAPMAVGSHVWFLANSMLGTVFVSFVLLELRLSPFELGITLAAAGVAGLLGSSFSTRFGMRWGAGRAVIICNFLMSVGWAIIAVVPTGNGQKWLVILLLAAGQAVYGLALGLSNANEMGYRQAVTPDHLQGRMNTTIRSANRAMIVVGAPAGGLLAVSIGYQPTLWIGIAGFAAAALLLAASPFRSARHGDAVQGRRQ